MELDPKLLLTHARKAGAISFFGIAVPFALGIAISRVMFDTLQANEEGFEDVSFVSFFVFIGTAMSITAFPVLARILKEGGLIYTQCGALTMGAAAIDDATAWCLLTLAISIANAGEMNVAGEVFACVLGFALVLLLLFRPIFERIVSWVEAMHSPAMNSNLFAFTVMLLFMCAWTTALLGVHAIFGAFLFGLTIPRGSHLFRECNERIEEFILTFTLPLYFTLSGLKTDVTTIRTGTEGAITVLVVVCATAGKFVGAGGAAYLSGMPLRESSVVAVLMNTRGLVELIVLNLGMQSGILNVRTFSVMVIMCLFTTFITSPLIELIYPKSMRVRAAHAAAKSIEDEKALNAAGRSHGDASTSPDSIEPSVAVEMKHSRVAVVVDSLHHMQNLVDVLAYFMPYTTDSELAVTALRFVEPTLSQQDEFLPLDEEGKLIRIDEETTDYTVALAYLNDPSAKQPELLPISVFCKAMRAGINAFRVQGDPEEFPDILKNLSKVNDCSVILFPWRSNSLYLQKFLWSSVHTLNGTPLALVVPIGPEHPSRSSSAAAVVGGEIAASAASTGATRRRGNSVFQRAETEEPSAATPALYTTMPTNVLPQHRRASVTHTLPKLATHVRASSRVLGIITGRRMDIAMLSLLLKFAQTSIHDITLLVPKNFVEFASAAGSGDRSTLNNFALEAIEVLEAFQHFQKVATASYAHTIKTDYLDIKMKDHKTLALQAFSLGFDLLVISFVEPSEHQDRSDRTARIVGNNRAYRSGSISNALADVLPGLHTQPVDETSTRLQAGVPARYAMSDLAYPELGVLGNSIVAETSNTNASVIILHEPHRMNAVARSSIHSDITAPVVVEEEGTRSNAPNGGVELLAMNVV